MYRWLQDQDAHHDLGGIRQASPLGQQGVDSLREVGKIDVPGDELQQVAQGFYFALVGSVGKQIGLDCAARGLDGLPGQDGIGGWMLEYLELPY